MKSMKQTIKGSNSLKFLVVLWGFVKTVNWIKSLIISIYTDRILDLQE